MYIDEPCFYEWTQNPVKENFDDNPLTKNIFNMNDMMNYKFYESNERSNLHFSENKDDPLTMFKSAQTANYNDTSTEQRCEEIFDNSYLKNVQNKKIIEFEKNNHFYNEIYGKDTIKDTDVQNIYLDNSNTANFCKYSNEIQINLIKELGSYKNRYPSKYKELIIIYAKQHGKRKTYKDFNLSKKNIDRWLNKGIERQKGGGRKLAHPLIEVKMVEWVKSYIEENHKIPKRKNIIEKAQIYTNQKFKASKGWCDKFIKRNNNRFLDLFESIKNED